MNRPLLPLPARPLVPIAIAFASGILSAEFWPPITPVLAAITALACIAGFRGPVGRTARSTVLLLGIAAAGALRGASEQGIPADDVSRFAGNTMVTVTGTVSSDAEPKGRVVTLVVAAERAETGGQPPFPCSGLVACTLVRDDRSPSPEYGDRIIVRGTLDYPSPQANPGGIDTRDYLSRRGIRSVLYAHRPGAWTVEPPDDSTLNLPARWMGRIRRSLPEAASRYLPPTEAALLSGILIGSRATIPAELDDDFQRTGTAHVLATAGLHVGLVAWIVHGLLRLFGATKRASAGLTMVLLVLYALAAGGRPPVVRAVLVTDLFLLGFLLQREVDAANSLAAAALVLLVVRPGHLFDPGFQLSFATVGSILVILACLRPLAERPRPRLSRRGLCTVPERIGRWLWDIGVLTTAAQVGSAPFVARYFSLVSPSGLPANLVIVPALVPVLTLGFALWAAGAAGIDPVAGFCAWLLHPLLSFVIGAVRTCSELPFAALATPPPSWPVIAAYYLALALVCRRFRRPDRDMELATVTMAPLPARTVS